MGKTKDVIQDEEGAYEVPRVRVWVHPHRRPGQRGGSDYPQEWQAAHPERLTTDKRIKQAVQQWLGAAYEFIANAEGVSQSPVVAYDGYEFTPDAFWQYWETGEVSEETDSAPPAFPDIVIVATYNEEKVSPDQATEQEITDAVEDVASKTSSTGDPMEPANASHNVRAVRLQEHGSEVLVEVVLTGMGLTGEDGPALIDADRAQEIVTGIEDTVGEPPHHVTYTTENQSRR